VTTIGWRMMHVAVGCFSTRYAAFFDPSTPPDADMFDKRLRPDSVPGTAAAGLEFFRECYERWHTAIAGLDEDGLARPLGRRGSYFADDPMAALIVHINREVMHHGGEIGVLRDLYARRVKPG
jgi:DinB superfamily